NRTGGAMSLVSVRLAGVNPDDFAVTTDGCSGHRVPDRESCVVTVAFRPLSLGKRTGSLDVRFSRGRGAAGIPLSGWGSEPALLVDVTKVDFGPVQIRSTSTKLVIASNKFTRPIDI